MTDNTEGRALLPCPFCGGVAVIKRKKTVMVSCSVCTATTFQELRDPDTAITAWNTRAHAAAEVARWREDAERYRWLRDQAGSEYVGKPYVAIDTRNDGDIVRGTLYDEELDAAIDAARAKEPTTDLPAPPGKGEL